MKNKAVAVESVREVTETRANRCQLSGHSRALHARFRKRLTASILIFLLGTSSIVFAQKQDAWTRLNGLKAGQGIEVIDSRIKRHDGEFVMVTDELLTLKEHGSDVSINRENVARVSTSSGPKRGTHAAIGLVAGAAVGAGIGAASGSDHGLLGGSSRGIAALVGLAIGGVSGAAVGALVPAHTTVYRAAPPASQRPASP
jgi:hypothetical protein